MGGLKICKKFQRTLVNIIKRNYSSTNVKVQREYKKINTLMCYIQRCIDEEHEKNKNLLCFNNVGCHQNNYHMLFYIHMLRMSYLLKNMTVNENKWLHIYKKMTTLYFLDEQYFHIKKKEKNYNEKNILNDHINVIDNKIKSNIIVNNDIKNIPPHTIERNICDKYNLFTLYSNYLFVYETILNKIYNYLSIYNTDDLLLLLNICDRFIHIFFTVCNNNKHKRMNKLNYIYIYSNEYNYIHNNNNNNDNNNNNNSNNNSNNYSNNFKIRKKGEENIYKHRSNHKDIFIHQYEDIYNLKYYQIFINIINLLTNILNTINYNSINSAQLIELINIFYRITKKGIINEKHIIKLFQNNIHIFKDIIKCPYTYNDIIFKIINIMHKSKIINSNIIFPIVIELKNRNIDKYPININFFEIYLKLLTLINIEPPYNLYLYHCCKEYILNNIYNIQPSKVYNFFFISNILGIYNLSILNIYIDYIFKRKDSHLNISSTHKIYYTLLGWSIIYNTILKNKYKHNKRNIKIILINFNNKNIHYIYDNKCMHINSYYDNLFGKLKYLLYFYKNKLICEKKKNKKIKNNNKNKNNIHKKHNNDSNYNTHHNNNNGMYISLNNNIYTEKENYQFNQFSIYSILKQYYPNIINEYTTNELISLDIFLYIHKQNSYKNIAIEFNGRTHYNLLINKKTSYPQTYTDTYQMVENYNTKYKKWILSNYSLNIIYIPYYKWNMLTHKQKEKYLTEAINMCSDIKSNINTQ